MTQWECPYCRRDDDEAVELRTERELIEHLWTHPRNANLEWEKLELEPLRERRV